MGQYSRFFWIFLDLTGFQVPVEVTDQEDGKYLVSFTLPDADSEYEISVVFKGTFGGKAGHLRGKVFWVAAAFPLGHIDFNIDHIDFNIDHIITSIAIFFSFLFFHLGPPCLFPFPRSPTIHPPTIHPPTIHPPPRFSLCRASGQRCRPRQEFHDRALGDG